MANFTNIEGDELLRILSYHFGVKYSEIRAQSEGGNPGLLPKLERIMLYKKASSDFCLWVTLEKKYTPTLDMWQTGCGGKYMVDCDDAHPNESGIVYCPVCGRKVVVEAKGAMSLKHGEVVTLGRK